MCPVMEQLTKIVSEINGFLWGMYCLIPLLCGVGIYFTHTTSDCPLWPCR